jgi:SAM-dependent methyltransferase
VSRRSLDLVFCAYGLYYAKDPIAVLASAAEFLRPGGRIVIVGPFGPNNHPLFSVLSACSVTVSDYVLYTSQQFMEAVVIPWATRHFRRLYVSTLANSVSWRTTSEVMAYWKSSTFYDASREREVQAAFDDHFRGNATFVNEKWIMMVEMADARG